VRLEGALENASIVLAERTSRRSFIGRLGAGIVALAGGQFVAEALRPDRAEAHHICGHTYTTNSCPHPYAPLTRIDRFGFPVHPAYGYPVDDGGTLYVSPDQRRRKICQELVPAKYPSTGNPRYGGGWSRCCHGQLRRIYDCCSYSDKRINGDASVRGYCYGGRKVFCIAYRETNVPC
jgi:hypothetical protein